MFVQLAPQWLQLIASPATSLLTYKNLSTPNLTTLEEVMEEANISKKMEYGAVKLRLPTGIDTSSDIGYNACITNFLTVKYARVWYIPAAPAQTNTYARTIMRTVTGV